MTIRIRFASGTEIRYYAAKDQDWGKTSKFIFILVFIMSVSSLQKNQTNIDSAFLIHMRAVFFSERSVSTIHWGEVTLLELQVKICISEV